MKDSNKFTKLLPFMEKTIKNIEQIDGIRLTWNIWPTASTKTDLIPIACLYNIHQPCLSLPCEPIPCQGCQSILCVQSMIDFGSKTWTCGFCNARNVLPPHARDISPQNLLPELMDGNSTVEYILSKTTPFPPIFVLLVDTCTYDNERHELMKRGLLHTLENIPDDALVGMVLFGTNIDLISFGNEEIKTIYQFSGKSSYTKEVVSGYNVGDIRNFLVKKSEKMNEIVNVIENLQMDPFPVLHGYRQLRCTGSALSLAISLIEGSFNESCVKYMLFTQGPCTYGPGKVSLLEIAESSTEKIDLEGAFNFYKTLGEKLNSIGHSVDIIGETIADIGIEQLKPIITMTGGSLIMAQDFEEEIKMKSLSKIFEKDENGVLLCGFNAKVQIKTSHNIVVKGILGEGKTFGAGWRVGSIYPKTNITILFENTSTARPNEFGYVQIITQYQRSDRKIATRVTSFSRMFTDERFRVISSFDQEAACVFQARAFLMKNFLNVYDFESAIDKTLIRFMKKYTNFIKDNPNSVTLPDSMLYYPNFMFFFRRSLLVQKDGISKDESSYFRILLFKLVTEDAIKMIKPSLISFHYQGDIMPVELDTSSLNPECILVLDSFHNVLLWKGKYVSDWIRDGLDQKPEYSFFKDIIDEATNYSLSLLDRIPVPQYKETNEGKSQERILLHYVNPSQQGVLNTEKIDYDKFYETLCRFIVRSD